MKQLLLGMPYWRYELKNFKKRKNLIKKFIKKYPLTKSNLQNYSSNTDLFLNNPDKQIEFTQEVIKLLSEELKHFAKDIKKNMVVTRSWAVSYKKGEDQIMHHHGNKAFTAIMYIDFDHKKHSPVIFKKPWPNIFTGKIEFIPPSPHLKEGTLLIFPACLEHFAPVNLSEKERTVISFDIDFNE